MIGVAEHPSPGVNLIGFLEAESGLGEIPRKLARALDHSGISFAAIPYRRTASRQNHPLELEVSGFAAHDVNLICLNADELPALANETGVELFADRYSIGFWFWETNVFRERDRLSLHFVDEVWTPSDYVRDAVARLADIPVLVAPIPIESPPDPTLTRTDLGLPPGYLFLFLFDFVSAERKNPLATVEAFCKAFAPGEGPMLVLKSINGRERKPDMLDRLRSATGGRPDILVRDGYVSAQERDAFVAACDCYVSLHRSEGFGLTMAEAMSHAKPVIATGYSGNLQFMDDSTSHLIPYSLTPIPESWWAHAPGAVWAEPDIDAAAAALRKVHDDPESAREIGARARKELLRRHSVGRAAEFVSARLRSAAEHEPTELKVNVLRAAQAAGRGVSLGAAERSGVEPVGLIRRLALRAIWPYLEDRHGFDVEVVDALARLQRDRERADSAT